MSKSNNNQEAKVLNSLRVAAERLLSASLSNKIQIDKLERLTEAGRRNLLLRCFINPIDNLPTSFIIKKVEGNYNPDNPNSRDTRRFFNDWIGTQFLNTISGKFQHSPRLYGGDRNLGFIVIEDVLHRNSLVKPLLGSDRDRAKWALLQYATCLSQLHTDTLSKAGEFQKLYQKVSPRMKPTKVSINIREHQSRLEKLGIDSDDWLSDLETIHETVSNPSEFLAYIHADACPDNVLDTGKELRLIDLETGFFGHAFLDAAYGRMMFPSCWCSKSLPHDIVQQMENAYRAKLIQRCPIAGDDEIFQTALANASGFWLLYTLSRHFEAAIENDCVFGISTIRQRILARLEVFIITSQEFNRLTGLRGISSRLLDLLRQRWSDVPELPLYPAFNENNFTR